MSGAAQEIIRMLGLKPHPEGGWYRETWRAAAAPGERACGTAIYFLLEIGQRSHWHRIDATEIWRFHAGAPLRLLASPDGDRVDAVTLGANLGGRERPQAVIPAQCWQSAESLGDFTLVSCIVSPGFDFDGFELAPPGWGPAN